MSYIPIDWKSSLEKECKRRNYSPRTVQTYSYCISRFLEFTNKTLDKISKKDVSIFLENLSAKERSGNTMNVYHMAIRFLFQGVLDKKMWINIRYSKVPEKIPVVLSKNDISRLFSSIENQKHKLMIEFLYSSGLRVSELVNLLVKDLDIKNSYGWVRRGKGNKDRLFIIAESLKDKVTDLIEKESLLQENNLFLTNRKTKYSVRSIQQILKKASRKSRIGKKVNPHALRHSFATHLIENGYSVSEVQSLLGHKSPETTFVYLHTAAPTLIKVKSPLDGIYSDQNTNNFQSRQPATLQNNPKIQNKAQNGPNL